MTANHEPAAPLARRKDLDRLRVLACLSTFIYHPLTVFDFGGFSHIKSASTSEWIDIASRLLHIVRMPLFFLIAGMVTLYALDRYTNRELFKQRALRLLVPFVVGLVLFAPWIKYFEVLGGRNISWKGVEMLSGAPPEPLVLLRRFFTQPRWFSWSHLWFLVYLFLLGAATLPLMRLMARTRWPARLPVWLALCAPLAALLAVELMLRPVYRAHVPNLIGDWANVAVYLIALLSGAALARFGQLERALQLGWPVPAASAAVGVWLYLAGGWPWEGIGRALVLWGAVGLVIGLGPALSRTPISGERYLAEAVLPLYVLHLLPLVVIAIAVKDLDCPVVLRYGAIVIGGFALTLAIYHWLVRPFALTRLALGLPAKRR